MFKFFYRFMHLKRFRKVNNANCRIEDAIESNARQLGTVDPDTVGQWQRLENTLKVKQNIGYNRVVIPRWIISKPAFSFIVAAAVLIVAGVVWLRYSSFSVYETAKGQHSNITLQDSTEVTLNYMSELKVSHWSLEKTRRVILKGEALFHVRRNGIPFIITTDVGTVQVLGTKFNVRVRDGKMQVAVLEGSVKLSVKKEEVDSSVVLDKGQIAICEKNLFPERPKMLPFAEYPGWIQGKFMFYRTTLLAACKEVEMQFDVNIKIVKPEQDNITITGTIDGRSIESTLVTIAQLTGNKYRHENGIYIIY